MRMRNTEYKREDREEDAKTAKENNTSLVFLATFALAFPGFRIRAGAALDPACRHMPLRFAFRGWRETGTGA
jgi:hypothetical protein